MRILFLLVLTIALLASCRSVKPEAPSLPTETLAAAPSVPSQIDIPVQIDLNRVYKEIEKSVPVKMSSTGYPAWEAGDNCMYHYKWNLWRDPLKFTAAGNTISIHGLANYQGEAEGRPCCWDACPWLTASCGINEPPRQAAYTINSSIGISPLYALSTSTTVGKFESINGCRIAGIPIDISGKLAPIVTAQINKALKTVDNSMAQFSFKNEVQEVWKQMHTPFAIDTLGYLIFNPQSLRISPLNAQNNKLSFTIGMSAQPRFLLNKENVTVPPLPSLAQGKPTTGGFSVYLDANLDYNRLGSLVNMQMKGMRLDFGKKHINILDVQLSGTGNSKMVIKVQFDGSTKGWMYLTGTPQYDATTQNLTMNDLDFDLKTRNILVKSAKWLFNNRIKDEMQKNAKFSVADLLLTIKNQVEQSLNQKLPYGVSTAGKVAEMDIKNIFAGSEYLQIRTFIGGQLGVSVIDE